MNKKVILIFCMILLFMNLSSVSAKNFNIVDSGDNSLFFVNGSSGNIGIGITTPLTKLDIAVDDASSDAEYMVFRDDGGSSRLYFKSNSTLNKNIIRVANSYDLEFQDDQGSGIMYLDESNRYVGIGTSPSSSLDVAGSIEVGGLIRNPNAWGVNSSLSFEEDSVTGYGSNNAVLASIEDLIFSIDSNNNQGTGNNKFVFGMDSRYPEGTNWNNLMVIEDTGEVGIGTAAPKSFLEIADISSDNVGQIDLLRLAAGSDDLDNIAGISFSTRGDIADRHPKSAIYHIQTQSGDWGTGDLVFAVDSNADDADVSTSDEKMRIDSTGNVGIGTTSPNAMLDIDSDSNSDSRLRLDVGSASGNKLIELVADVIGSGSYWIYATGDSASDAFVVRGDGNVGIGETNPDNLLHITKSADTSATGYLKLENTNTGGSGGAHGIEFYSRDNTPAQVEVARIETSVTSAGAGDSSYNMAFKLAEHGTLGTKLYIKNDGNVGIGTTGPSVDLHINASDQINLRLQDEAGGTWDLISDDNDKFRIYGGTLADTALTIQNDGNVGIGTTGPDTKLHVDGGSLLVDAYTEGEDAGIFLREGFLTTDQPSITVWDMTNGGVSPDGLSINAQDGIRFRENSAEAMRIKDGNVGIGTTGPDNKLHIKGDLKIEDSASTDYMLISRESGNGQIQTYNSEDLYINPLGNDVIMVRDSGNVGIGITSPDEELHVVGEIQSGAGSSTSGSVLLQSTHSSGPTNIVGSMYSSGGSLLGYGIKSSSSASDTFLSTYSASLKRAGIVLDGDIEFWTGSSQTVATGSPVSVSQVMTIKEDGDVGIGTTSPSEKLEVIGSNNAYMKAGAYFNVRGGTDAWDNYTAIFRGANAADPNSQWMGIGADTSYGWITFGGSGSTGTRNLVMDDSGNVGIGTTSPNHNLEITSSSNSSLGIRSDGSVPSTSKLVFEPNDGADRLGIVGHMESNNANDYLFLGDPDDDGTSEGVYIKPSGALGVGVISPETTFHVSRDADSINEYDIATFEADEDDGNSGRLIIGTSWHNTDVTGRYSYLQSYDGSDTDARHLLLNPEGGNVGIGTTSPQQKLNVQGTFNATQSGSNMVLNSDGNIRFGI